ncbi:hypothetical protein N7535_002281 [Penicillium sp. DV-2018c]|nr:hypothetical protein N7461_004475 [Penicillium sp. DV-2018c]KAJ5583661.1 hypothetical protein N7535_002281 [Penicillium sp. DV-2018c]
MAPRPIATPAQSHALSIPEIFELILLNLDTRTLLTKATRICRTWTQFINSSPALQWALFFRPLDNVLNKSKIQNPLLAEVFPSIFRHPSAIPDDDMHDIDSEDESDDYSESHLVDVTFTTFDFVRRPHKLDAYMRPEASWRRMLVQQPPVYTLALLRSSLGHGGQHLYHYEVLSTNDHNELSGGLRMEALFEVLVFGEIWDQYDYPATQVAWGLEDLPKWTQRDLKLYGVGDLGLVLYTPFGENGRGRGGHRTGRDSEHDAVKNVKGRYDRLGIEPKYSEETLILKRKTWGSLWD